MSSPFITVLLTDGYPGWQPQALETTSNLPVGSIKYALTGSTDDINHVVAHCNSDLIALVDPDIMPQPGWGSKAYDLHKINGLQAAFGDSDELALLGLLRPDSGRYPAWQTLLEHGRLWDRHELIDPGFCVFTRYAWDVFGPFRTDAAHPIDVFGMQATAHDGWAVGATLASYGRPV